MPVSLSVAVTMATEVPLGLSSRTVAEYWARSKAGALSFMSSTLTSTTARPLWQLFRVFCPRTVRRYDSRVSRSNVFNVLIRPVSWSIVKHPGFPSTILYFSLLRISKKFQYNYKLILYIVVGIIPLGFSRIVYGINLIR